MVKKRRKYASRHEFVLMIVHLSILFCLYVFQDLLINLLNSLQAGEATDGKIRDVFDVWRQIV